MIRSEDILRGVRHFDDVRGAIGVGIAGLKGLMSSIFVGLLNGVSLRIESLVLLTKVRHLFGTRCLTDSNGNGQLLQ